MYKEEYAYLEIKEEKFCDINLSDSFFDTLKNDYDKFQEWFDSHKDKKAYVKRIDNKIVGFLYLKIGEQEKIKLINSTLSSKNRIKIGTFKLSEQVEGSKIGEGFLKIVLDKMFMNRKNIQEVYTTIFSKQQKLIELLMTL